MRKAFFVSILAAMSISLVACGGGGGGGPIPTPIQTQGPTSKASIGGGFIGASGGSSAQSAHIRTLAVHTMADPVLTGAILPFAVFAIKDGNVNLPNAATIGYTAVAYLDTSNGSTLPSTLPTASFAITGGANTGITLGQVLPVPTPDPTKKKNVIAAQDLGQPTAVGETVITATATGGYGSVNLTADTYHGLGLTVQNPPAGMNTWGNNYQVSFDSNGTPYTDPMNPDLTVTLNNGVTTLTDPHGIIVEQESLSAATASQFPTSSAATSVTGTSLCTTVTPDAPTPNQIQATTYLIGTAHGVVAWQPISAGFADNNCDWLDGYGPYRSL